MAELLIFLFVYQSSNRENNSFAMAPADNEALQNLVKGALQNKFPIKLFQTSEQLEEYLYGSANAIGGIDFHLDFSVS